MAEDTETLSPILPNHIEELAAAVLKRACDAELKIATAESCTGGLLASLLTDVEGASHAFDRGFVVYSEQAKCDLLGVARAKIDQCGVVSREVAAAMVAGALTVSEAQVAVAITGFAGAGAEGDEPGLVHFAAQREGEDVLTREEHFGDIGRGGVRIAALQVALEMLREVMG